MRRPAASVFFALILSLRAFPQAELPTFKAEVRSTFVWGEDAPAGAISSTVKDPLTGTEILKLKHNDVEINSQMGFEKVRPEDVAEFIAYSTTIINNTQTELTVEQRGIAVDGHLVTPLLVNSSTKGTKKRSKEAASTVDVRNLHCFSSRSLSSENFFSLQQQPSSAIIVEPQSSLTVSGVIKDPRHYPLLCTAEGCSPKGTIRYSVRVGGHEYVFSWNGRLLRNCGR
ncbi:MAG TPA: hypothetical protein VMP68_20910 [Candidatus Eisenbacteria bacterium]|nr:hypothetical protein [Candidatus Eisenbacteria bacterium]